MSTESKFGTFSPPVSARKGQIWSSDFALSVMIFTAASVIAFMLLNNAFDDRSYDEVNN